ncbi:MAG: hypothetical protein IJO45_04890 [Oscillospiraceae bacterium]|nr:hypothetical protein [Oscillospiraceae bacterium]
MKCEYCGSMIKTVPDNGICPNCGGTLQKMSKELRFPFPNWEHRCFLGRTSFREKEVCFRFSIWLDKKPIAVPYDQIIDVAYGAPTFSWKGYLCIRTSENPFTPMPERIQDITNDDIAVCFTQKYEKEFFRIYGFLKKCAEENRKRQM